MQEPESNACLLSDDGSNEAENCRIIKSPPGGLSLSYGMPLISMLHSESGQEIMRFSSPTTAARNHSVDSASITSMPSFGNNYLNLDLTLI